MDPASAPGAVEPVPESDPRSPTPPSEAAGPTPAPMPDEVVLSPGALEAACANAERLPWRSHIALLTNHQLEQSLAFVVQRDELSFSGEVLVGSRPRLYGFDNSAALSAITSTPWTGWVTFVGQNVPDLRRQLGLPCRDREGDCPARVIREVGRRVFRRPLTQAEVADFETFFSNGLSENFDDAMDAALRAMLLSPHFLYRSELGEPEGRASARLTDHELLSWLSYTFLDGPPPRNHFDNIEGLDLASAEGRRAVVSEWFWSADELDEKLSRFIAQYLGTDGVRSVNRDETLYPRLTPDVLTSMEEEIQAFTSHVVFDMQGSFSDLMAADFVMVDRNLSEFYGLETVHGDEPRPVALEPTIRDVRGGLLTTAAFAAAHAHPTETSPVERGVFVRENIMCHDLPSVPPSIDTTPPVPDASLTTRQRFQRHSDDPQCVDCHRAIDPIGFGFERYDADGSYRQTENGLPVDDSGQILGLTTWFGPEVVDFRGPKELGRFFAEDDGATRCFARQVWRYFLALPESMEDRCDIATVQEDFLATQGDIRELFLALAAHPHAHLRRIDSE